MTVEKTMKARFFNRKFCLKNIFKREKSLCQRWQLSLLRFLTTENTEEIWRATEMETNKITEVVIGCAIKVHKTLGPGLLESAYQVCLSHELMNSGLYVRQQLPMPVIYEELHMEAGYRLDLLVENKVIVEIKSVEALNDVHIAQVLTYLKLSKAQVGLLINFNVMKLTNGIKRLMPKT